MDRTRLEAVLAREFDGDERDRRVVARQAGDLADAGLLEADLGVEVTVETVRSNLADAPDGYDLRQRWNWWIGSLSISRGGYDGFAVRSADGRQ